MDVRPSFRILNSNKFWRYRTLCTRIPKCGFPTKGIKLTLFVLFEVLGVPQLWGTSVKIISVGDARNFAEYKWCYEVRRPLGWSYCLSVNLERCKFWFDEFPSYHKLACSCSWVVFQFVPLCFWEIRLPRLKTWGKRWRMPSRK